MIKLQNYVTPRMKAERARREAMPLAKVIRPAHFVAEKTNETKTVIDEISKEPRMARVLSPEFMRAKRAALKGDGLTVQRIALAVAAR